jgi:hypothetical protein
MPLNKKPGKSIRYAAIYNVLLTMIESRFQKHDMG